ncbi:MAG: hypothetical protein KAH72_03965 [Flavobacteriaceae bacterium]|nr:hypothetical protein [Flavobacteriaceae bacterium]
MCKNIAIYYKDKSKEKVSNVDLKLFDNTIMFDLPNSENIDEYISSKTILELNDTNFDVIYIKDNLSSNYLELYGIRVAYHIRLSQKLETERYVPIVILSDVDSHILNKLDPMARILFTKNIFIVKNTKVEIKKFQDKLKCQKLTEDEYKSKFLNLIELEAPKESHHDIANEWAIYKWAKELKLDDSDNINNIVEKLSSQLYFKYIKAKYSILDTTETASPPKRVPNENPINKLKEKVEIKKILSTDDEHNKRKKILYIDDEHDKGWDNIFKKYFSKKRGYELVALDITYKDRSFNDIETPVLDTIVSYKPDLIILDMRLVSSDHKKEIPPMDISGIKILNSIKNISLDTKDTKLNPGIQVIMLTASGRSDILNEALKKNKIVGYIKKEHPEDITINTNENIKKLDKFIDNAEKDFYLKKIWALSKRIINIINNDPFQKYVDNYRDHLDILKKEIKYIFDISKRDIENKNKYAMVSIYTSFETIEKIFMKEIQGNYQFKDTDNTNVLNDKSLTERIVSILTQKLYITEYLNIEKTLRFIAKRRNDYLHSNKKIYISSENILDWFKLFSLIIDHIQNPKPKPKIQRRKSGIRHVDKSEIKKESL